ncbi:MAG: type II toxin-antitoxin system VapC family toxin [Betaproteobacteria bacterium]
MSVLLDTHFWVWWLTPRSPLSAAERAALDDAATRRQAYISAVSLWEAQMLHAKGRLELPMSFGDWLEQAADERMLTVLPIDIAVILALDALPRSFHGDPADRIIVATARSRSLPLATRDASIRKSRIASLWKP